MMINYYNILQKGLLFKYLILASILIVVILGFLLFNLDSFKLNTYYNGLSLVSKADKAYQDGNWAEAGINFTEAKKFQPDSEKLNFNLANAYYKQGRYKEASILYDKLIDDKNGKLDKAVLYYNLGATKFQQKFYYPSFEAFRSSLLLNDKDEKTRQNFLCAFDLYMKSNKPKGTTRTPKGPSDREGERQTNTNPNNNGGNTSPTDPSLGPYQVSDRQMQKMLSLSKLHEHVPSGTKSAKTTNTHPRFDGPDY